MGAQGAQGVEQAEQNKVSLTHINLVNETGWPARGGTSDTAGAAGLLRLVTTG